MNRFFEHINRLVVFNRKKSRLHTSDLRFIFVRDWLNSSYYERMWDLTPKKHRPRGMVSLWIRKL
jgi:hypothetical protein